MPNPTEMVAIYGLLAQRGEMIEPDATAAAGGTTIALSPVGAQCVFAGISVPEIFASLLCALPKNVVPDSPAPLQPVATGTQFIQRGFGFEIYLQFATFPEGVLLVYYPRCDVLAEDQARWDFGRIATGYRLAIGDVIERLAGAELSIDDAQKLIVESPNLAMPEAASIERRSIGRRGRTAATRQAKAPVRPILVTQAFA